MEPYSAMPRTSIIRFETAKLRSRNIRTSTTGCSFFHSQMTKKINAAAATTAYSVMVREANQSFCWPVSSTTSRQPSPTAMSPRPT